MKDTKLKGAHSMERAKQAVERLGPPSASFTVLIRQLQRDHEVDPAALSRVSIQLFARLCNSPSLAASFYYATKTFHGEKLTQHNSLSVADMIGFYQPRELAAVLSAVYCYRNAKKLCPEDEWKFIGLEIAEQAEIGMFAGQAISAIGPAFGLLAGAFRPLAFAAMCIVNENKFILYRRHLKSKGLFFDRSKELEYWGCTYFEIGSYFLQSLGFGLEMARGFIDGLESLRTDPNGLSSEALAFRYATLWIEALESSGRPAHIEDDAYQISSDEELNSLLNQAESVNVDGSAHDWLERGREDLTAESAPELFANSHNVPKQWSLKSYKTERLPARTKKDDADSLSSGDAETEIIEGTNEYRSLPRELQDIIPEDEFFDLKAQISDLIE